MGAISKGLMSVVMCMLVFNQTATWIVQLTIPIVREARRPGDIIPYPNWLKAWGGLGGREYTTGIRPRSYYRRSTKTRGQQIGHKIAHMTTHHKNLLMALKAKSERQRNHKPRKPNNSFDSDSHTIMIDCGATMSITNDRKDFTGKVIKETMRVQGISGYMSATEKGLVKWKIEDNQERVHNITTPAILNKKAPHRLWSPQHWAQHIGDKQGTTCTITGTTATLKCSCCGSDMNPFDNDCGSFECPPFCQ